MNTEFFIARRIAWQGRKSFSKIIVRIAILAVALGLAVMLVSGAIINGFNAKISEKIFGFWGHIHITDIHLTRSYDYVPIPYSEEMMAEIEQLDGRQLSKERSFLSTLFSRSEPMGVQRVHSFAFHPGIIQSKSDLEGIMLKGLNREFQWKYLEKFIVEGDTISWNDTLASRSIVISKRTSERLQVGVGDALIVQFVQERNTKKRKFTISGIYKTGLEEYDVKFALCDIRVLQDLLGWESNEVAGYEVFVHDVQNMEAYADDIYNNIVPQDHYAETIKDKFPNIFDWLDLQRINEYIILFLMILVSIINMTTVILIIILERSRMIGILKSIGFTNWSVRKLFIYLSFWISVFGLLIGNILGLGFCFLQQRFGLIKLDEVNYYVSTAPIKIDILNIVLLNLMTLVVIAIFMIFPSFLISRIKPVKVLRFD